MSLKNPNLSSQTGKTSGEEARKTQLRDIMEASRKVKALKEKKMEEEMAVLQVSGSELAIDMGSGKKMRLPKLSYDTKNPEESGKSVGLAYDNRMLKHCCTQTLDYGKEHPERPERISRALEKLNETDMLKCLYLIEGAKANLNELLLVHLPDHIADMSTIAEIDDIEELELKQMMYESIYFCKDSYECALISCGSTLSLTEYVVRGNLKSGFALVRPPGHHAESHTAKGFCLFNNVAVAAKHAQATAKSIGLVQNEAQYRVLILDWDVHHGNGTQNSFYCDPSVLYISLHRYEHGSFYPSSAAANFDKIGSGDGEGYNVNIPWSGAKMGDAEYHEAFEHIVMPIAKEFNPNLVLVSSGFDAGKGDPLGGFRVTPKFYGYMTHRLLSLADGKVVVVLEGGYNLRTVAESVQACTESLLMSKHSSPPKLKFPNTPGLSCILETMEFISSHWACLKEHKSIIEEKLDVAKRAEVERLTRGFETLEIDQSDIATSAEGSGGHSYVTRAKSRLRRSNEANLKSCAREQSNNSNSVGQSNTSEVELGVSSDDESEGEVCENNWEALEFQEPQEADHTTPTGMAAEKVNSTSGNDSSTDLEISDVVLSFHSAKSSLNNSRVSESSPSPHKKDESLDTADHEVSSTVGAVGYTSDVQSSSSVVVPASDPQMNQQGIILALSATGMNMEEVLATVQANLSEEDTGYVVPKDDCPHVNQDVVTDVQNRLDFDVSCNICNHGHENWTCLKCGIVFCGRFVNQHMVAHYSDTFHAVALSHSDLSFWCYKCDSYLNNYSIQKLKDIYRQAHVLKHGTDLPT